MHQLNFLVIKLTINLIFGILVGYHLDMPINTSIGIVAFLLISLFLSFLYNKRRAHRSALFGIISFLTFIGIGILTTSLHNQKNHFDHYSNLTHIDLSSDANILFKVRKVLKPSNYHDKYIIDIKLLNDSKVTGRILLNVEKDSINTSLDVDDVISSRTALLNLMPPLNPNQFDYKEYLEKQQIFHQIYLKGNELLILDRKKSTIYGLASEIRESINSDLIKYNFKEDELAIINALLLGQRQDISKEIYDSYAQAGAIHILAVSGLHIGIILLILNYLFKPFALFKHGNTIKILLIVILLWCFAVIAGLSASVTRAVTMFSLVAIGMNLKRPTNIYNTLAISMFLLLLIKPAFLFDVGFQLSYLAVFAIVWIQPILYGLWFPKIWVINKFWQIFTVTVAAQLGVAPISLYYFHQFPGLFFVSNLVIVPLLGLILGFGILIIILAVFNILPLILASTFGTVIEIMNRFVSFVSGQEAFLFKHISFNLLLVLASYLLIASFVLLYKNQTYKRLLFGLIAVASLFSILILNRIHYSTNEFAIFHKSRFSLIGLKTNTDLLIHHNLDSLTLKKDNVISNYKVGKFIKDIETDSIRNIYKMQDKLILVVDSIGIYNTSIKPNYILLRNSPKINIDRLIDSIKPELIISDGSNYKTYQERWKNSCLKKEIPFHQTSKKGAFMIKF